MVKLDPVLLSTYSAPSAEYFSLPAGADTKSKPLADQKLLNDIMNIRHLLFNAWSGLEKRIRCLPKSKQQDFKIKLPLPLPSELYALNSLLIIQDMLKDPNNYNEAKKRRYKDDLNRIMGDLTKTASLLKDYPELKGSRTDFNWVMPKFKAVKERIEKINFPAPTPS